MTPALNHATRRAATLALLFTAFLTAMPSRGDGARAEAIANRLVRVSVTHQMQNPFLPWIRQAPGTREGYGVLLDADRVLTTEGLVRNATHVELRQARSGEKFAASVVVADPRLNLALLTVPRPGAAFPRTALERAPEVPPLGATLQVLQFDDAQSVQPVGGRISQVGVAMLPDSPYALLKYDLLTELNINGAGAPVVWGDRLAGLVMMHQASTRVASVIGAPFLESFIADASSGLAYRGPAAAGFRWRPLVDPAKRAFLNIDPAAGGIQVLSVMPGFAAHDLLRPLDVILEWDGHPLDALGYYIDPDFGRVEASHLVKTASAGDRVPVTLWRDGAAHTIALELGGDPDAVARVPENVTGTPAEYLVTGGLVLRELDMFLLRAHGSDWRANVDSKLLNFYTGAGADPHRPGDRVVLLAGVLPDAINVGYQHFRHHIVTSVNGVPAPNLETVFAVSERDGGIDRLTLDGIGVELALDRAILPEANARLMEQYRLPALEFRRVKAY